MSLIEDGTLNLLINSKNLVIENSITTKISSASSRIIQFGKLIILEMFFGTFTPERFNQGPIPKILY